MKKNIFLYLFVFVALILLYSLVNGNKIQNENESDILKLQNKIEALEDSVQQEKLHILDIQYFSLENNDDALAYYEHLNLENPTRYIEDKLLETNENKGDNPLIPYEGMDSDFKINKIKVMNHRWIVADFSDGQYWGDLVIKYELKDDMSVDFTLLDHLLYTRSN
ncbi:MULTISPECIES: hydrolase [Croceitalea]|uniref:Hydrolase n=1 Tax=Croceitalea vernalis TaxID=3075599 RepID=A0ABU3BGS8_9FLAO|nr:MULTISPECIES: hydrolase [unclassified Croceitalea]MDT0539581.1 hydrolase [Croceitalea sp. P059]MDT0621373.1 hydrolase [Croceitalea sp. P007]